MEVIQTNNNTETVQSVNYLQFSMLRKYIHSEVYNIISIVQFIGKNGIFKYMHYINTGIRKPNSILFHFGFSINWPAIKSAIAVWELCDCETRDMSTSYSISIDVSMTEKQWVLNPKT